MLTRFLTLFIALQLVWTTQILAAPAMPDIIETDQSDGTRFKARIHGDEFQNWVEAVDSGHTVIHNKQSKRWEYAEKQPDGSLKPSGVKVSPDGSYAPSFLQKGIKPERDIEREAQQNQMLRKIYNQRVPALSSSGYDEDGVASVPAVDGAPGDWTPATVSGSRNVLIVLVNFSSRSLVTTADNWNGTIFDTAPGAKSVANYYNDNSFGTLTISPATHTQPGKPAGIVSVTVADAHPDCGSSYNYTSETNILNHALAQAASFVNFASFDANGDGMLEQDELSIYFIYAGYEASGSSNTPNIWAHAWSGTTAVSVGGKYVTRWALSGELNYAGVQHPMGVIAHELGHALCGLPDLYDTSSHNAGLGNYSLMAGGSWGREISEYGGVTPVALDAWSRQYIGWTTPVVPASNGSVSLGASLASANNAIKLINTTVNINEYWLAENRLASTGWDRGLRGLLNSSGYAGGLLITHIDVTSGTQGANDINRYVSGGHQGVMAEMADSSTCNMLTTSCRGAINTLYYSGNNSSFNSGTTPASKYYNGTASFRALDNISAPGATMTATFSIGGAAPVGFIKINGGAIYTSSPSVTLNLTATVAAPSTVKEMCFSNDGSTWSTWEAYKTTREWTLDAGGDGDRTVTVKYRDAGSNESIPYGATITLDTTRPTAVIAAVGGLGGPTKASVVSFSASSADVVSYKYKIDSGSWSAEIPVATTVNYSGLAVGNHTLSIIGKDAAGNWQLTSGASTLDWTIEQVPATTTASPSGGNYVSPQSVSLSANETATIYFTTNGTIPTAASATYSGPISITATTSLKYFSVDVAGNVETVKSQLYNLPPTATVSGVPASTKLTTATLTVGGGGVVAYKYTLDGGLQSAEIPVATKIALTGLSVANHTVSLIGKNSVGQWQSTATTVNWTVEKTPATVSATPAGGSYGSSQSVTLSANETATIYYTVTGASPTTASPKYTTPLTLTIPTTLKYLAVDSAGNASAVKTELYLPPPAATVTGTPPSPDKLTKAVLTVGGVGITHYKFKLDSGAYSAVEIPIATKISLTALPVGSHTVSVIGKNGVGDWQSTATTASWTIEQTPPVTTASPLGGTYAATQTVALSASETATIYYTTNGAAPNTASARYTAPITVSTTTTLKYFAVDQAGNAEAVKMQVYLLPLSATVSGVQASTKLTTATLTVGGVGVVAYKYTLDGGLQSAEIPVATKIALTGLSVAHHTVSLIGKNSAGQWQSTPTSVGWTVEQAPAIIAATPAGGSYNSSQNVTLSANETATIYYTITGKAPTTASPKYTTPLALTIPTTLKYLAVDSAGNVSAVKTELYLPLPVATFTGTPASPSKLTTATLTVGGVGITHYKFKLDSGAYSAVEIPITTKIALTALPVGSHTVSVIGKNGVGDWQSTATTASWTIEQAAPITTASPLGGTYAATQTVELSASEAATIYYTTNGAAPTTASTRYTAPITVSTTTTLKYFAVDQAGNAEAVKSQVYALAPVATISGVPDTVATGIPIVLSAGGGYVVAYKYRMNGAPWSIESPVATVRTLAGLPAGTHLIEVIGKNAAGTWQRDVDATAKVLEVD